MATRLPLVRSLAPWAPVRLPSRSGRSFQYRMPRSVAKPAPRLFSNTALRQEDKKEGREWTTPLAEKLAQAISITGPVPVASYMRMCLTGDIGGYYTGLIEENRDQFGLKGDFVTSPEISQVFGELIGIWYVAEWMSQGQQNQGVELIELGPGRGTLMDDILRTIQNFKPFSDSIETIYLVEASPTLREAQKTLLCGADASMTESKLGFHSVSKYGNIPIVWTESVRPIPKDPSKMPFMVAHEFFDALPIHALQNTARPVEPPAPEKDAGAPSSSQETASMPQPSTSSTSSNSSKRSSSDHTEPFEWRELVVSPTPPNATHQSLNTPKSEQGDPVPEFQLTLSSSPTRHAQYLPTTSPRYQALKDVPDAIIEVCPDASMYAADMAARIGGSADHPKQRPSGAALILDYGTSDSVPINSLRGIRRHRRVNPFIEPGLVDLSADVDFMAIAESATKASDGIEVHGPVDQSLFLAQMGIKERAEVLAKKAGSDQERADNINRSWKRLVDRSPGGMGKLYKALAILPENDGRRRPVGFGGDI